jgi:glycerophosphoryl diester phosphodiesterase
MNDDRFRPLLLGHRGARGVRGLRENTIASFDRALADGCDGFEFDVRRTADGAGVIWHDPESTGKYIEESTAAQLPDLVRLEDVVQRYQDSAFLDIELKVAGLERLTAELLQKFPPRLGVVVSSFLPEVIQAVQAEDSSIPLGLICEHKAELRYWPELPVAYVIAHYELLEMSGQDIIAQIQSAGKKVMVWTVNDARAMRRYRQMGVDGIISDKTKLLSETLRS